MRLTLPTTLAVTTGLAAVAAFAYSIPPLPIIPYRAPATTPQEAQARLRQLDQDDEGMLLDRCRHQLWHTGARAESVVVLLHGFTNCPHQFHQLGALLHRQGHAVLAARLPYHGQANRTPSNLSRMTPAILADYLGELLAIAHGLGRRVTLLGFSFGGVLAGWIAQQRADVDHLLLVSPSLGLQAVQRPLRRPFGRLGRYLPDVWRWWDPELREDRNGPPHGYLGFTLHSVATILRLGEGVVDQARRHKPQNCRLTVVVNAADQVVDIGTAKELASLWRQQGADVDLIELGEEQGLIHDFMDPTQPKEQVAKVYPQVCEWLTARPV